MNDVIGLINDIKNTKQLKEIIKGRSTAAVPFGGRYRMIDFALSNMINSGIQNVGILVQRNYRSLMGHIRSAKEWDLDRKKDGLFILPPGADSWLSGSIKGDLEILYSNLDYIARSKQRDVIISGLNIILNTTYNNALKFHRENKNDITVIYKNIGKNKEDFKGCTTIKLSDDGRIFDMKINTKEMDFENISLDIYIMSKKLLVDITCDCISRGEYDFLMDGIIKNIGKLKIYGFPFNGYAANINSIKNYYKYSMDLLKPEILKELFFNGGYVYTKAADQAPAKFLKGSETKNSLIANGCIIEGSVENSILFRKVKSHKNSRIINSIIMQNCEIEEDVILENVIIDKDSKITKGMHLSGSADYPMLIEKKTVL